MSKPNNMSLAIDMETQNRLKEIAKKRNISTSKLIRDIIERNLSTTDEDVDTIILKIPSATKETEATLRAWLNARVEMIVKALLADANKS